MNRRAALLSLLSIPLVQFDAFAQVKHKALIPGGVLTVPLDNWAGIVVTYQGKQCGVTAADIFAALSEGK